MNWLRDITAWYACGLAWRLGMLMYGVPLNTRRAAVFSYLLGLGGMREFSHDWEDFRVFRDVRRRENRSHVQLPEAKP